MKDYYQILQVTPEATLSEIKSAYRRLMLQLHPDILPSELRDNPQILQIVQDINEAYEVLRNPIKRKHYDSFRENIPLSPSEIIINPIKHKHYDFFTKSNLSSALDISFLLVRCGKNKNTFKAILIRQYNSQATWTVMGFIKVTKEQKTPESYSPLRKLTRLFNKYFQNFVTKTTKIWQNENEFSYQQPEITMGEIDWGAYKCPNCASYIVNQNGTFATWKGCSHCGYISCVGHVKITEKRKYSTCPWCNKTKDMTRSVSIGKKDHLKLKGHILKKKEQENQKPLLEKDQSEELLQKTSQ